MSLVRRVRARVFVLAVALTASLGFSVVPPSFAVTVPKPLNDTRSVGLAPVEVDFPIEHFGLVADLSSSRAHLEEHGRAPFGEARFRVDGRWTAWQALGQDGAQAEGQFTGALVSVDRADAYQVRGLPPEGRNWRAAAINTSDGPDVVVDRTRADAAVAAPTCMSRADWGADEKISGWNTDGDEQAFSPAQIATVHHTAGSNNTGQDYADTVRAIYSYHVKSNGWSDIGYQYLVDGDGVLYEGRSTGNTSSSCLNDGGDGSDFAHEPTTDEVVTGAHTRGYNTGNVGIALMGCFEPVACSGSTRPTYAAQSTLEAQLAKLATRHDLDPEGTVRYVNPENLNTADVDTISGHRDHGQTQCPGEHLYDLLPMIRRNVASRMAGPDAEDPAVVSFARARRGVRENAGTVRLRVTRSGNTSVPASVDYARTAGTATPDSDFTLTSGTLTFAAGETSKAIPLSVADDHATERRETLRVELTGQAPGTVLRAPTSMSIAIRPSDQQPDGLISTSARTGYVGNDRYNSRAWKQTRVLGARRTETRSFFVRVQNDGNVTSTVAVHGTAARRGSRVAYFVRTTNITSAMRSAQGWRVRLEPGTSKRIRVRIRVRSRAAFGSRKPALVTSTWTGDGTHSDTVKAVVKVIR